MAGPGHRGSVRVDTAIEQPGGDVDRQVSDGGNPSVLRVDAVERIGAVLDSATVPRGRPVVVLVGGAGGMGEEGLATLDAALRAAVLPVLAQRAGAVIDGGTDAGVMRAIGRVRRATGSDFPLVGVAAEGTVILPGQDPPNPDAADLDPNHTHVVLVPGSAWGDESPWLGRVAAAVAAGQSSVTILVNGGEIAYRDVAHSLSQNRPVVVLSGTGRTAETIAAAAEGTVTDPRAAEIARSALTRIVPVDDVDAIRSALDHALA
jgi:hypothetical protein